MLNLTVLSDEILLHILSYLDLPDLAAIADAFPRLEALTTDPILHIQRLTVVTPARLKHSLFSTNAKGVPLRPTIGELVQRGVIRGLNIEQRWRMGQYIYGVTSIRQFELTRRLDRELARTAISRQLSRRSAKTPHATFKRLHSSHVLFAVESSSPNISRNLLPVMYKLKWSLRRDRVAKALNTQITQMSTKGISEWLVGPGRCALSEHERVRLAVCPDISRIIRFYEGLSIV